MRHIIGIIIHALCFCRFIQLVGFLIAHVANISLILFKQFQWFLSSNNLVLSFLVIHYHFPKGWWDVRKQCRRICSVGSFSVPFQNLVYHLSKKLHCNLRSCEGFFVDQQQEEQLKQAEPVTSPLCPERRIIVDSDRCHPYYIVSFVFATTFPWRVERLSSVLPHHPSRCCCA